VLTSVFFFLSLFVVLKTKNKTTRLIQTINGNVYYSLILIAAITVPLQGLPTFIIYLLPKLRRLRRNNPDAGWWHWFRSTLGRNQVTGGEKRRRINHNRHGITNRENNNNAALGVDPHSSLNAVINPSDVNNDDFFDYDGEEVNAGVESDRIGEEVIDKEESA
jgi:hypothetical protein